MDVPGQSQVSYAYDDADQLRIITQGTSVVSFAYDDAGRRTSHTLPNGIVTEYTYDPASRLTALTYKLGGNTLGTLSYGYNDAGERIAVDGTWARTSQPAAVASATYNAANHQLTFGAQALTYDLNGSLTSDGTNTYTWNARNQLTAITGPTPATFMYDGQGRRKQKAVNAATTDFLYDGLNIAQEQAGAVTTNSLVGLGIDERFVRSNATETRDLLIDALGSTIALADGSGSIQTSYTYEAFGVSTTTGALSANPYGYTGRESDGTGLYYYRARYYQPGLQRFISEDPIGFGGGDWKLYAYVRNSPTTLIDPTGLLAFFWHGGISALAAYNCGRSLGDSLIFGLNTMLVDVGTQGTTAADANIHAMLGTTDENGAPLRQTPADAATRIELIISTGPDYLAAHTAQDKAAAQHYLQPWFGRQTVGHIWHDAFPSLDELRKAYQGTREVLAGRKRSCTTAP